MPRRSLAFLVAALILAGSDLPARILVRLSPNFIELASPPNRTLTDRILYVNAGTDPVDVRLELSDFDVDAKGNAVEQAPGSSDSSLVSSVRVSPTQARVEPGQSLYFRYRIEAPEEFTHLRAMIYFISRPVVAAAEGTRAIVVPRMGIPVYLENDRAKSAELVITRGAARAESNGVRLDLEIRNLGERNIRPTGAIQIDTDGGPRFFDFNEGRSPVLPGHAREWSLQLGPLDSAPNSVRLRLERSPGREMEQVFPISVEPPPAPPS